MNKVDFHKHLQNSGSNPVLTTAELERLVERYPYFQTAQLLLTKAYLTEGDYRQTDQVQQAALYAGDRSALFHWLRAKTTGAQETGIVPSITESLPSTTETPVESITTNAPSFAPIVDDILQVEEGKSPSDIDPDLRDLANRIVEEPSIVKSTDHKKDVDVIPVQLPNTPEKQPETAVEAVQEVPSAPIPNSPEAPVQVEKSPVPAIAPELQETILIEAIHSALEQEIQEDARQQQIDAPATPEEPRVDETELSPFARWMQQRSKEIAFEAGTRPMPEGEQPEDVQNWLRKPAFEAKEPEEAENDVPDSIETRLDDLAPEEGQGLIAHSARRMDVPQKKDQQKALIDRFIQLDPRITPGKAADYSISDLAKESLEDDMEFVTETMAQLFVIQGKIDRAKKAFKKLMVLHPEKSVYFATQLKNIDRIKKL
ncbi:MAG: hypothetical protein RLZZ262_918 [Bacteroidota bacterium]|jgi:hypothetical protein